MKRARGWLIVLFVLSLATLQPAAAEDKFLASLSKLATRELRKQLTDKQFHFLQGPLEGDVQAVEPDKRLTAEVKKFELANDVLATTLSASGRFKIEAKVNQSTDVHTEIDVTFTIVAEARFSKEDGSFFVTPRVRDMEMTLQILAISPANLSGGEDVFSSLAMAAFNSQKQKIIAAANKQLGKRPF